MLRLYVHILTLSFDLVSHFLGKSSHRVCRQAQLPQLFPPQHLSSSLLLMSTIYDCLHCMGSYRYLSQACTVSLFCVLTEFLPTSLNACAAMRHILSARCHENQMSRHLVLHATQISSFCNLRRGTTSATPPVDHHHASWHQKTSRFFLSLLPLLQRLVLFVLLSVSLSSALASYCPRFAKVSNFFFLKSVEMVSGG